MPLNGWGLVVMSALSLSAAQRPAAFLTEATQVSGLEPAPVQASVQAPVDDSWSTYKVRLAALARQQGVREATIQASVPGLTVNRQVIELERTEPVARSSGGVVGALAPYLRAHVTSSLISRGREHYADHYDALRQIDARYGVDPAVLMAIWGVETSYGTVTGGNDLLQVLASLGYYGRRRELFESEFIATLKLMDQGVPRWRLKGSWAGATGYPQFMPSVVLRLRADGDGDGYSDIWANELDGLASIAAYLRDAGWKPNLAWGIRVRTPAKPQPRRDCEQDDCTALPPGISPAEPLADDARMAGARRDSAWAFTAGGRDGESDRTRRPGLDRLSTDHQLSGDPRL